MKPNHIIIAVIVLAFAAIGGTMILKPRSHRAAVTVVETPVVETPVAKAAPAPAPPEDTAAEPPDNMSRPADQDIHEGYAAPTFSELAQTFVLLNGHDITDPRVADEYGRVVYCKLYEESFGNDIVWEKVRSQIVSRVLKKKEYYRVKYEIVSAFNLGRYDFKNRFFPLDSRVSARNVGILKLFSAEEPTKDCTGSFSSSGFSKNMVVKLSALLTVEGFYIPQDKVEKMMVRMEEGGETSRRVYARIRISLTDAVPSSNELKGSTEAAVFNGEIDAIDFFLDPELTKPVGHALLGRR